MADFYNLAYNHFSHRIVVCRRAQVPILSPRILAGLVNLINGFQTAMHWACKRGDENLAKMLAGVSRNLVNERSVSILLLTHICNKYC